MVKKRTRADAIILQMHTPTTTQQLFNINTKVKRQEKGPEVMLCYLHFHIIVPGSMANLNWRYGHGYRGHTRFKYIVVLLNILVYYLNILYLCPYQCLDQWIIHRSSINRQQTKFGAAKWSGARKSWRIYEDLFNWCQK